MQPLLPLHSPPTPCNQSPPHTPNSHTSQSLPSPFPSPSHSPHRPSSPPTHGTAHTQPSTSPPNDTACTPPPLHSLFTTEDSDGQEPVSSPSDNSESESREKSGEVEDGVTFKAFKKARNKKKAAKKRLDFDDVTEKADLRPKRTDPKLIHSETQRMIRESKLRIPEYTPPTITLREVLKKLPKLTSPPAKPDTLPSPIPSKQTTSTPLPKSCPAPMSPSQLEDLPDIDFLSAEPAQRLELTQEQILPRLDSLKLRSISTSLPAPKLAPNDITHLDLTPDTDVPALCTLESFKSRFITQSIGPVRKQPLPHTRVDSAPSEDDTDTDSLLPSATLSKLASKPGAAHAFLHDKLRRSLMAKRAQEHRDMQLRSRYENEELLPSEDSCDVPGAIWAAEEREEVGSTPLDMCSNIGSNTDMCSKSDTSSSSSSSESSSESESESDVEGSNGTSDSNSDSEDGDEVFAPNLKAKRQVLAADSDSEGQLSEGDGVGQLELSLEYTQPRIPTPTLSIERQLSGGAQDENEAPAAALTLPCAIDYHCSDAVFDSFTVPSLFQLPLSQGSIPEGLSGLCDPPTQQGDSQLHFLCTGGFATQVTQATDKKNESALPVLPEAPDRSPTASLQLDETLDTDIPVLAPRQMRTKDKLRLKRYQKLAEFEEREAELSGSDQEAENSEYGSDFGGELDEYEYEDGDLDAVESEEVERVNAKYYNKIMIEDDEANLELLKDRFLPEQDIVEDGLRMKHGLFRKRKFNFEDDVESSGDHEWGEEVRDDTDQSMSQERRRRRVEREDYIAKKSGSTLSDLKYGDTPRLPLADGPSLLRASSCDPSSLGKVTTIPSIRKSLVKHNSLLSRSLSSSTRLNPNLHSESNSDSNLVGRKAFVFQTTRSLDTKDNSSSVPSLAKSVSVPSSRSLSNHGHQGNKAKLKSEFPKDVPFTKPTSFFHLLNAN